MLENGGTQLLPPPLASENAPGSLALPAENHPPSILQVLTSVRGVGVGTTGAAADSQSLPCTVLPSEFTA